MIRQFHVPAELQQFLSGVESKALINVVWDITFPGDAPLIPTNPNTTRRALMFSRIGEDAAATPDSEFNCYLANVDGSSEQPVTTPRGLVA